MNADYTDTDLLNSDRMDSVTSLTQNGKDLLS